MSRIVIEHFSGAYAGLLITGNRGGVFTPLGKGVALRSTAGDSPPAKHNSEFAFNALHKPDGLIVPELLFRKFDFR
ncbi:MAG TPA: hypothetical protein VF275_02100 [Gammaproteobacteria bacterium]